MTTSPYETLEVPVDADDATIRRAYRKKAKKAHPDGGGSEEEFAALTLAALVLSDPARRDKFDRTGEVDGSVFDADQEALNCATQAVVGAIASNVNISVVNILLMAQQTLAGNKRQLEGARREAAGAIKKLETVGKRFAKKKAEGRDWIADIIRGQIGQIQMMEEANARNQKTVEKAQELLSIYEYVVDATPNYAASPSEFIGLWKFDRP